MNPLQTANETAYNFVTILIRVGLVILGAMIIGRVASLLIGKLEDAVREDKTGDELSREKRARTIGDVLRRTTRGALVTVTALIALRELGFDINPLLATAGGFGLAAGLGAQSVVRDWISGFFIIRDNQIAVGDVVRVAGVTGTAETVSLRHSEIRDGDGSLHFVPNGEIKVVTNLSKAWSTPTVRIPVSLTEDPTRALQELRAMAARFGELPAVKPHLLGPPEVLGIEDVSAGQFTILLQVRTRPDQRFALTRAIRLAAIERLRAAGIELHTAANQSALGSGTDAPAASETASAAAQGTGATA